MKLIETKTLGTAAASIVFTSIPQTFTDLIVLVSARRSTTGAIAVISFNSGGTYTKRNLLGNGSSAFSATGSGDEVAATPSGATANTFGNSSIYIPNYSGLTIKSYSVDSVNETSGTSADAIIAAGLWSETSAITSITITPKASDGNFVAGSIVSLYGITKGSDGIVTTS
jgi:hypothetical protein